MTQQALPLLPAKKEKPLQAASKAEPQTKENDLESKIHSADKNKEEGSISSDAATTDRYRYSMFCCCFLFSWIVYLKQIHGQSFEENTKLTKSQTVETCLLYTVALLRKRTH